MGVFTSQFVTVQKNDVITDPQTRKTSSKYVIIKESVPCRITGTHKDNTVLFMLKRYWDSIPGGIHRGYKIVNTQSNQCYIVEQEPIWAGGKQHHIELILGEWIDK